MARTLKGLWPTLFILASVLVGCKADTSGLPTLTVPELAELIAGSSGVVLCDANNEETRQKQGVIPGSVLLSSYKDYDVATELPQDKAQQLVFYCANEMCSSAPTAARMAIAAGYSNVHLLPAGIAGWVKAEQPVERPSAS